MFDFIDTDITPAPELVAAVNAWQSEPGVFDLADSAARLALVEGSVLAMKVVELDKQVITLNALLNAGMYVVAAYADEVGDPSIPTEFLHRINDVLAEMGAPFTLNPDLF